ncbi:MarR family winged helix-turn-helix transcriptional regulator [Pseudonocardia sp. TRM90224]|uniref:MarR family winged helix-turn-helix transcriptional regulator n=1 Tax=Pseudonocardia sp. TRM90224 TaxID=2812678 RepID=UPI001E63F379|nr:MarR family transcriptional regulator [Pseudonocardia sp. TRM90224]
MSDETLAEAFWAVARQLRLRARETLTPWEITPAQSRAMMTLLRHGTIRLSALADHLGIAPRSTTEVVDALQDRGLVERQPDPQDRRATLVVLTPGGSEAAQAMREARAAESESFFNELNAEDRADLTRILGTLRQGATAAGKQRG